MDQLFINSQNSFMKRKNMNFKTVTFFLGSLLILACSKDPGPVNPGEKAIPNFGHRGIYIVNEGSFTQGNSTLSFIDLDIGKSYNDLFQTINKRPLGDVFQSMSFYNGKAFLVVNNSQKIEVADSASMRSISTISGLNSPRKIITNNGKGYISDLYSNILQVFDLNTGAIIKTISTGGWTESMLTYNGNLYVTVQQVYGNNTPDSKKGLLVIDPISDAVSDYIPLVQGAESLVLDKDGFIWVLCNGGYLEEVGGLFRIDPETGVIERSILFPEIGYSGASLQINKAGDQLFFIYSTPDFQNDILGMNIRATSLPIVPLLDGGNKFIYGYGINEFRNEIYLSVPSFGVQSGYIYRYSLSPAIVTDSFRVGIFPSQIIRNQ